MFYYKKYPIFFKVDYVKALVKIEIENVYKLEVPLDVDLDIGDNWLEAH